jgi:hypothetical protein
MLQLAGDLICQPNGANGARFLLVGLLLLAGCSRPASPIRSLPPFTPPIQVTTVALNAPPGCRGHFVEHLLDHTTTTHNQVVTLYESNGAGVAINDLDGDGDLDIVLANLRDPNTIFWNQGELRFLPQRLTHGDSRAVAVVDVDGDGWHDLVFTRRLAKPTYWRNLGSTGAFQFVEGVLPDVHNPFYSMAWGDLDGDGDLDLVAGSYDTELRKEQGAIFDYRGGGVGIFVYTRQGEHFVDQRLAVEADALTIALPDLNADGQLDILVGNDFSRPDYAWLRQAGAWVETSPFRRTSENTMSLDEGDINNDSHLELFATDMKPYQRDVQTMAAWLPMMDKMTHPTTADDPQTAENVLQVRGGDGRFYNQAYPRLADATGWSWSSRFGDLDNDGFLDIYVVNGMIAQELFSHLLGNELVEENQALRNDGHGSFTPVPAWRLGSTASGRGMSMADLDNDGDLDIVVNNLLTPAQLFENRLCGGAGLEVDLRWPESGNFYAIGARLTLHTSSGSYYRTLRTSAGYLSGDPTRIHFGLPAGATPQQLIVQWPDGVQSHIEPLGPQSLVVVERGQVTR